MFRQASSWQRNRSNTILSSRIFANAEKSRLGLQTGHFIRQPQTPAVKARREQAHDYFGAARSWRGVPGASYKKGPLAPKKTCQKSWLGG
jgi:hypothetical protein